MVDVKKAFSVILASAALLATAPYAVADEGRFLRLLDHRGIAVYDATMAANTGYWICGRLQQGESLALVTARIYDVGLRNEVPDVLTAAAWTTSAYQALCEQS